MKVNMKCLLCSLCLIVCIMQSVGTSVHAENVYHYVDTVIHEAPNIYRQVFLDDDQGMIYMDEVYLNDRDSVPRLHQVKNGIDVVLFQAWNRNENWEQPSETDYTGYYACRGFDIDEEGKIYVYYELLHVYELVVDVYASDGTPIETGILLDSPNKDDSAGTVVKLECRNGSIFVLFGNNQLFQYAMDGSLVRQLAKDFHSHDFAADSTGKLYVLTSVNGTTASYELQTIGSNNAFALASCVHLDNSASDGLLYYSNESESVFLATPSYIDRYDIAARTLTRHLDFGTDTGLLMTTEVSTGHPTLQGFAISKDGDVFLATYNATKEEKRDVLYALNKTAGAKPLPQPDTVLTITAAFKQDFLLEAVRRYVYLHPNVEIKWDVICPTSEAFYDDRENAGKKLATKIMTNDVGDIVSTGGMGMVYLDAFKTDAFIDLWEYIRADEDSSQYNQNTLESLTLNGELKGFPVGIGHNALIFNQELAHSIGLEINTSITWGEVLKIGKDNPNIPLFGIVSNSKDMGIFLEMLLIAQMPDLINLDEKNYDLRQEWFLTLLADYKEVYQSNLSVFMDEGLFRAIDREHLFEISMILGQYDHVRLYYDNANGTIQYLPMPEGELHRNAIAYPTHMYSISNNSKQKDAAWELLNFLALPTTQAIYSLSAIPLNTVAEKDGRDRRDFPAELDRQFDDIVNATDFLYDYSHYKQDLRDPLQQYMNDEISLEEAIDKAEYNVWIRLNE